MENALFIRSVCLTEPPRGWLREIPAITHLMRQELTFTNPITFFVGENGTGKSTLLEAIAVASGFNPEGGTRNFNFSTNDTHSDLSRHLRLSRTRYPKDGFFLRAESFYNVASYIDKLDREFHFGGPLINSYGGVSLHDQSHGESFLALVQHRFHSGGLYLLDEPEAALSPMRLLTLMAELHTLASSGAQFLIATHSPILMSLPGSQVLQFTQDGIEEVSYRDTEHFQITKQFLDAPERMLHYLLGE